MKERKKIAFIHYPHFPTKARLETMPFALNSVISLAKMGWNVDLYLWEYPSSIYKDLLPDTVSIKYLRDIKYFKSSKLSPLNQPTLIWLVFQFQWPKNYCCVFGLGQIGAYIANIIAKSNQCPFIYFNDEFPSSWIGTSEGNFWGNLEKRVIKNAAMVIVPDSQRFPPLCQELDVSTKPYAMLPNMPMVQPIFDKINWHEKLGIAKDRIPFLHAGQISNGMQIPEILASVPYWHEKAVLILHSRFVGNLEIYRQSLSHLEVPGKVFWSSKPISENQLHSLVSYCAGNFALYRNSGPNIEYMGFSSGKLMRSLVCGSPVIASKLTSLSFIEDYQLGVLVNHPSEIPAAIEEIIRNREDYSIRCLNFCNTNLSFNKAWQQFCDQFEQVIKIDLRQPICKN